MIKESIYYTPQAGNLLLFVEEGDVYGQTYYEFEVRDNSAPKMPRQCYIYRRCPKEQESEVIKSIFAALNLQYPGFEWIRSAWKNDQKMVLI